MAYSVKLVEGYPSDVRLGGQQNCTFVYNFLLYGSWSNGENVVGGFFEWFVKWGGYEGI